MAGGQDGSKKQVPIHVESVAAASAPPPDRANSLAPAARRRSWAVPVPEEPAAPTRPHRPNRWLRYTDVVERVFGWQPQRCPCCEELMRQVALVRAGAGDVLSWLQRQGDLVLVGPPARGDPGMAEA